MKIKKDKGFTLIELIVVIGIMGIMSVGIMLTLNPFAQFQKANDARRKSDLAQIQRALEIYYQDKQQYPLNTGDYLIITNVKSQSCSAPPCNVAWGTSWQPYVNLVPKDPTSSKNYAYSSDGQSYFIYASLDKVPSSEQCQGPVPCGSTTACGSGVCNFGVSSPDKTP
jgi:prepilin-type N-terminal cleavage/methylation domain-containing protein